MRNLLFIILLWGFKVVAQTPQSFKYQTAIRDNSGALLANKLISLKISLLRTSPTGETIYIETHNVSTNDFGVANLNIGTGNSSLGNFADIDWSNGPYFLKAELDINNGSNFIFMGTSQLLSVPFALFAAKSGNAANDFDKDSLNEIQQLTLENDQLKLSKNGGQLNLETYKDNTDSQKISLQGNTLSISGGNSIVLAGAIDLDSDPTNELQEISIHKDTLKLSKTNFAILPKDFDGDSINELQSLSIIADSIKISKGNTIKLPANLDNDSLNEIQSLTLKNDTLSLTKSNQVVLPKVAEVPLGTVIMVEKFDSSLLGKGYEFIGKTRMEIQQKLSDTPSYQWGNSIHQSPFAFNENTEAIWANDKIIIYNNGNIIYSYNIQNKSYTPISAVNSPSNYYEYSLVFGNNEMIVYGGINHFNNGGRYNPSTNSWTLFSLPSIYSRSRHAAVWVDSLMYVIGGSSPPPSSISRDCFIYNPRTGMVSTFQLPSSLKSIHDHVAVRFNNEILLLGGSIDNFSTTSININIYKYNLLTQTWSTINNIIPSILSGNQDISAVSTGNEIIVYGSRNCIIFNPISNVVQTIPVTNKEADRFSTNLIWTGNEVILWGKRDENGARGNGIILKKTSPTLGLPYFIDFYLFRKSN